MIDNDVKQNQTVALKVPSANGKPHHWKGLLIYQIYIHSFLDSEAKGHGTLQGIIEMLPYVKSLNVDMVWITPFYPSPNHDFGYDVSNYCDVSPKYGTLEDFDRLIRVAKELQLGVMIDLVLSHTSIDHPWFTESRQDKQNSKADWYVWADAKPDGTPPNNWLSIFGGTGWQWDTQRCQYYLHNFLKEQPDLNFHNVEVQKALLEVLQFWLDRGVSGFRFDTVNFYFCDKQFRDNPAFAGEVLTAPNVNPYTFQRHIYDKSRPENIAFLEKIRNLTDKYENIVTMGEVGDDLRSLEVVADYTSDQDKLNMCYGFDFLCQSFTATHFVNTLERFRTLQENARQAYIAWSFSNHDVMRAISRFGIKIEGKLLKHDQLQTMLYALLGSLGGSCVVFQGEELGLEEVDIPLEKMKDPYGIAMYPKYKGRDGCRTPMPWSAKKKNYGFTENNETWLPIGDRSARALDVMEENKTSTLYAFRSFWSFYKNSKTLMYGDLQADTAENYSLLKFASDSDAKSVLVLQRKFEGQEMVLLFNVSAKPKHFSTELVLEKTWDICRMHEASIDEAMKNIYFDGYAYVFFNVVKNASV